MIYHRLRLYFACVLIAAASLVSCNSPTQTKGAREREKLVIDKNKKIKALSKDQALNLITVALRLEEGTYTPEDVAEIAKRRTDRFIASFERKVEHDLSGAESDLEALKKVKKNEGDDSIKAVYEVLIKIAESLIKEKKAEKE